jgi:NADH-quinone oxidoreductase subunit J
MVALAAVTRHFIPITADSVEHGLFYFFGGGAVISGVMMITDHRPVYAALWFAVVTLATCGLFLLNAAPFLAAATVIVYAGAIVVTFLFVIMLAQQAGATGYDRKAYQAELATMGGFLMLGAILFTLQEWGSASTRLAAAGSAVPEKQILFVRPPRNITANPLSKPVSLKEDQNADENDLGTLQGVGRSLFGDYLFAVELAGTVLLIATIGAIALAPRRSQGTL